jgi:glycosyltransferase involved in cell wall biosynthesis
MAPRSSNRTVRSPAVSLFLPALAGGGAERVFVDLANEFGRIGLHVDLVLAAALGPYLEEVSPAVRVVDFDASGVLASLPKLARYLRTERPRVLLSGLDHANVISILARAASGPNTRCVVSMRSVPTMLHREAGALGAWTVLSAARLAYRFADAVIANSEGVAADLSRSLRVPRHRIAVIYNPINATAIRRLAEEQVAHPWCEPASPPLILSAGRLSGLKDFPTLIRAFALLRSKRDCRLVILGEGPDRGRIEGLVQQLGLQDDVSLPGFVGNPFAWMSRAKVFVSSSISEGCPNALMQALACGTPVVGTDCPGGSAEILEAGKWGALVPVGQPQAMADAIGATLATTNHPDGRRRTEAFAPDEIAHQYLRVLLPDHDPPAKEQ